MNQNTKLIGSLEESFYQLGLRERRLNKICLERILKMMGPMTRNKGLDEYLGKTINGLMSKFKHNYELISKIEDHFTDGLEIKGKRGFINFFIPEIAYLNKIGKSWQKVNIQSITEVIWAQGETYQLVINQNSLLGSFKELRTLNLDLFDFKKMSLTSPKGLPFLFTSGVNEDGVKISVQNIGYDKFNLKGIPLSEFFLHFLNRVTDLDTAIQFATQFTPILSCNFIISFKDKNYIQLDFKKGHFSYEIFKAKESSIMSKKEDFNKSNIGQLFEKLYIEKVPKSTFNISGLEVLSSNLEVIRFNTNESNTATFIDLNEKVEHYKQFSFETSNKVKKEIHFKGLLQKASYYSYTDEVENVYYYLQLSIHFCDDDELKQTLQFLFYCMQVKNTSTRFDLLALLEEIRELRGSLKGNYYDECLLMIFRIEKMLGLSKTVLSDQIKTSNVKRRYGLEDLLPKSAIGPITRNNIHVNLDRLKLEYFI